MKHVDKIQYHKGEGRVPLVGFSWTGHSVMVELLFDSLFELCRCFFVNLINGEEHSGSCLEDASIFSNYPTTRIPTLFIYLKFGRYELCLGFEETIEMKRQSLR